MIRLNPPPWRWYLTRPLCWVGLHIVAMWDTGDWICLRPHCPFSRQGTWKPPLRILVGWLRQIRRESH